MRETENKETTKYISKKLITCGDYAESTFKGAEVVNCSIEPQGDVKAIVNQLNGTIEFKKFNPLWHGEVSLYLETTDGIGLDSNYINNYKVQFKGDNFEESHEVGNLQLWKHTNQGETSENYSDVELLSENEKLETAGGGANIQINLPKGHSKWITAYDGGGKKGYGENFYPVQIVNFSGWVTAVKGKVRIGNEVVNGVKLTNKCKLRASAIIQIIFKDEFSSKKVIRRIAIKC